MGMMVPFMAAEDPAAEADGRIRCLGRKGYTCIAGGPCHAPCMQA